jgi:hypothetical protein
MWPHTRRALLGRHTETMPRPEREWTCPLCGGPFVGYLTHYRENALDSPDGSEVVYRCRATDGMVAVRGAERADGHVLARTATEIVPRMGRLGGWRAARTGPPREAPSDAWIRPHRSSSPNRTVAK